MNFADAMEGAHIQITDNRYTEFSKSNSIFYNTITILLLLLFYQIYCSLLTTHSSLHNDGLHDLTPENDSANLVHALLLHALDGGVGALPPVVPSV